MKDRNGGERPERPIRPVADLSGRHRSTLERIFARPARSDIPWRDILSLFKALGAEIDESKSGSRVGVLLGRHPATFHEPHPGRVTDKGAVESVRKFLEVAGVRP